MKKMNEEIEVVNGEFNFEEKSLELLMKIKELFLPKELIDTE
jgi:hypothetical protein